MNKSRELSSIDNDIVMYILVNMDLGMYKGKIASQVAHSACEVERYLVNHATQLYREWSRTGYTKIVLKSNLKEMEHMTYMFNNRSQELWCAFTRDFGRTQVEPDSLTTLAFNPIRRKDAPDCIKKLKLL